MVGSCEKPALCQARKTWPVDLSYLFVTFSRERTHQEQKKDGMLTNIVTFYSEFHAVLLRHRKFAVEMEQLPTPCSFPRQYRDLFYYCIHSMIIVSNYGFCLIPRENQPVLDKLEFRRRIDQMEFNKSINNKQNSSFRSHQIKQKSLTNCIYHNFPSPLQSVPYGGVPIRWRALARIKCSA